METNIFLSLNFLNLLDKHFNRDNLLRKVFDRNTVKISHSCTKNMHSILNNHNRRLLDELNRNSGGPDVASCNCKSKEECSLGRRYNSKNVVYLACISPRNIIMMRRGSILVSPLGIGNKDCIITDVFFLQSAT